MTTADPIITVKRTRDHVLSWIKINKIKQDLNEEILSVCMPLILQLFDSSADLLQYLTMYSDKPKLDAMYQIIHSKINEFRLSDKKVHLSDASKLNQYFSKISNESIINICSFLSKKETIIFKIASRRISIICLKEMNKYTVGICLASNLLNVKQINALEWKDKMSFKRFHISTPYSVIFEQQQQHNNFDEKYQIPVVIDKYQKLMKNTTRFDKIVPKSSLILFNKTNLTILDYDSLNSVMNERQMVMNDTFNCNEHCLIVLYHFDVYSQKIHITKYLIINNSITIKQVTQYIKDKLLLDKIRLYHKDHSYSYTFDELIQRQVKRNCNIISLVYQATYKRKDESLIKMKCNYEIKTLNKFYFEYQKRETPKQITLLWSLPYLIRVKQQIKHYIISTNKNKLILDNIMQQIDSKYANTLNKYKFQCDSYLDMNTIKQHFSQFIFQHIIPAKYIQIYQNISSNECNYTLSPRISLGIVPYDTTTNSYIYGMLHIKLYAEKYSLFPFISIANKIERKPIQITIKVNTKTRTVSNIMREIIKISKNALFETDFIDIKESFDNYEKSINANCYAIYDDYKYIEEELSDDDNWGYALDDDDDHGHYDLYPRLYQSQETKCIPEKNNKYKKITKLKIFMIPTTDNNYSKYKLTVRFAWNDGFCKDKETKCIFNQFIGLPLFVWCNKNDTLSDILENNAIISEYKSVICETYKVTDCYQIVSKIEKVERGSFEIYNDLIFNHDNDKGFIVITIHKKKEFDVGLVDKGIILSDVDLYEYDEY